MEPNIIALYDQVQAEMRQQARVVAAYLKQLREEGVDEYDAMRLSLSFQHHFVFASTSAPRPEPDPG